MFSQSVSWWKTWYYNWRILVVLRGLEQATARRDSGAGVRCVWTRVLQLSHRCTSIFDIWRQHLAPFPCWKLLKYCSHLRFFWDTITNSILNLVIPPEIRTLVCKTFTNWRFSNQRFLQAPINEDLYSNVHRWDNRRSLVWRLGTDVTVWRGQCFMATSSRHWPSAAAAEATWPRVLEAMEATPTHLEVNKCASEQWPLLWPPKAHGRKHNNYQQEAINTKNELWICLLFAGFYCMTWHNWEAYLNWAQ